MIDIKNIAKIYKLGDVEVAALNEVTCRIETGEIVSIMGPSGSGKSTLMNLIGCLDRPTSGTYELDGIDVSTLNDNQLAEIRNKKIGFVFQSYNLLPQATAVANVELPLVYSGVGNRRQRAFEALELVDMANRARHRPTEISGGEQQRVAIARALVTNPSLILADEPTGNLDTQTSNGIMLLLQRLNSQGITIVLVTHEEDIAAYTQRTIYLRDGKIVSEKKR
ncbi:MAG: ABC transporter ATP-binding protein [Chloroflexi bacterium]|nr:ABC transporter ATP-binding protein [Chloroflexota bacterium]MBL7062079.1 ABC transporter ATP-binding protein [Dehalococcoidia bacterium]